MKKLLTVGLLLAFFVLGSNLIYAQKVSLSPKQESEIRAFLQEEDVSYEDQNVLIQKIKDDIPWDCYKKEYRNLQPQIVHEGYEKTVYPDGSFKVDCVEEAEEFVEEFDENDSLADTNYYAPISPMAVMRTTGHKFSPVVAGGTYRDDTKGFLKGWKNQTNAWYAINANAVNNWGGGRCYIKTYVNSSGARDVYSFPGV